MVLLFCAFMVVVLVAFVQTRMNMKAQTKITFRQLKAHYMAQSGVQHALLKLRVLPLESFDAASVSRGICPFLQPGSPPPTTGGAPGSDSMLKEFCTDLTTDSAFPAGAHPYPISAYSADFPNWHYRPLSVKALMASKEGDAQTHAIEIQMEGEMTEKFKSVTEITTTDIVTRTVKITRTRQ